MSVLPKLENGFMNLLLTKITVTRGFSYSLHFLCYLLLDFMGRENFSRENDS